MSPSRRRWLAALAAAAVPGSAATTGAVRRGRALVLPADHGAHLDARTEWWYGTGWLGRPDAPTHGFQITFFRSRTGLAQGLPGRLAPRHLLFAHAALTDLAGRRHAHEQRSVRWNGDNDDRQGPRQAGAATDDLRAWIGAWSLRRTADGYRALAGDAGSGRGFDLELLPTQPPLLQGDAGFSRKGPDVRQASHYYSLPQLAVRGSVTLGGSATTAAGRAWLDHEWSDEILAADAVGWDWIGINAFDGAALTAFRLRRADGSSLWAGGSHRVPGQEPRIFGPDELRWTARRHWRSPASGARYPVQWQLDTPVGGYGVRALLDAQELDGRLSTGTVYWEGLSELLDAGGRRVGLGYLEMTGYAGRLRL